MVSKLITALVAALFLPGLLVTGVLGTETRLLFFWPGCALLGAAAVAAALRWRWRLGSVPSDLCLASVLVFAVYMVARQGTSPVEIHAREDMFVLLACLVVYTLSATVFSRPGLRFAVVAVLVLLTAGNLAAGFIQFSGKWGFHVAPGYLRSFGEEHRIGGFFNNPNHLAAFLAAMTLFFAGLALLGRLSETRKLLLGFLSLSSGLGVALAVSRGALMGLAAGGLLLGLVCLFVLWKTSPHLLLKVTAAVAVLGVVGGLVLYGVFSGQLGRRFGLSQFQEGEPRLLIWRSALDQYHQQPWWGAGARMFYEGCVTYRHPEAPLWLQDAEFVHNEWLQMLADYGRAGLLLLVVLLAVHFHHAWRFLQWFVTEKFDRTARLMSNSLGLVSGAMAALAGMMVHALFEFQFHVAAPAVTAAFFLGILANPGFAVQDRRSARVPGCRTLLKLALFTAGCGMLHGAWIFGRADYYAEKAMTGAQEDAKGVMQRLSWLTKAVELDPGNAHFWHQRGLVRLEAAAGRPEVLATGLLKRAVEDLERAHRHNPYSMFPALALADAYDALRRPDDALRAIDAALRAGPLYELPRLALALHWHRLQRWEEAEAAYLWAEEARAGRTGEAHPLYLRMLKDAAP